MKQIINGVIGTLTILSVGFFAVAIIFGLFGSTEIIIAYAFGCVTLIFVYGAIATQDVFCEFGAIIGSFCFILALTYIPETKKIETFVQNDRVFTVHNQPEHQCSSKWNCPMAPYSSYSDFIYDTEMPDCKQNREHWRTYLVCNN